MQWWTDFLNWLNSDNGGRIVSTVVVPFVAIIVAGIVAAGIGRASARKVIELSEREVRASSVTALISAARKAAVWNTLPAPEQQHIDHLIGDAEIRLRLLPIAGTGLAADWARHEIAGMKRNAISYSFQAEQSLLVFRDRLIEWQGRPNRAKKLFKNDLDSWAYDSSASEQELVHQQQKWAAQQVTETGPITTVTTSPFSRPPAPAPIGVPVVESTPAVASLADATAAQPATMAAVVAPENVVSAVVVVAAAEPTLSTSAASVSADDGTHPLVEPADTSSHDVSTASIFAADTARESTSPEPESEHTGVEHTASEHTGVEHTGSDPIERDGIESDSAEQSVSDAGETDNHHDDHEHNEHEHEHEHEQHNSHDDDQHNEWRG